MTTTAALQQQTGLVPFFYLVFLLLSCYLQCNCRVSAWTPLADRLSGRYNDPQRHSYSLRARHRRRSKAISQDHLSSESNGNSNNNNGSGIIGKKSMVQAISSTKKDQRDMMEFIRQPMDTLVGDYSIDSSSSNSNSNSINNNNAAIAPDLLDFVHCIVKAADGRKADDIVAMHVAHITTLSQVLILLSGNSRPQNQAIAAAIVKDVAEQYNGLRPGGNGVPEGSAESGWMLLDYGSVMVHVMTPKSRLYYNVEGQWKKKGGQYMDISSVLVPNKVVEQQQEEAVGTDYAIQEDDPFWS